MGRRWRIICLVLLGFVPAFASAAAAADWPMWRHDAARTAVSPEPLAATLHLKWVRRLAPPVAAWPASQTKLQFDASYEPVVCGRRVFVGSMVGDHVTAYDTETGRELWRFHADGPVRFAPVAWEDRVAFVSDDGYLRCLDAATGELVWRVRGGPAERRVIGNDRLISTWPARGAPVLADDTIYFAAGIWPFMGIFIHAVDAETGRIVWTNGGSGSIYIRQQHNSPAFAGVAPQGYLAVAGDTLLVSGGRTVPAAYDRATGALRYFHVSSRRFGKDAGGYEVFVGKDWFVNRGAVYRVPDGAPVAEIPARLSTEDALIGFDDGKIVGYACRAVKERYTDSRGKNLTRPVLPVSWEGEPDVPLRRVLIKAGPRVYAEGDDGLIAAVDLPVRGERARVSWQGRVDGEVWTALAADGKLLVVTRGGGLYCFGPHAGPVATHCPDPAPLPLKDDRWAEQARTILNKSGVARGYCLVPGIGTGRLVEELVRRSNLHVTAIDPDVAKVASLRRRMDAAGLYGRRVTAHVGHPSSFALPPYFASLAATEDLSVEGQERGVTFIRWLYRALRPYGGLAWLPADEDRQRTFRRFISGASLAGADVNAVDRGLLLEKEGPPPGAANWTHQYADAANTIVSQDEAVRLPLGLLWFGGPANDPVLPRHGHGPSPHVVGGRVIIEGRDMLRAVDAYTGRLLWQQPFSDLGAYYDNTDHQPGANEVGSNYVSVPDAIYVANGRECLRLDPETGRTDGSIAFPDDAAELKTAQWGYLAVHGDLLVATALPVGVELAGGDEKDDEKADIQNLSFQWNSRYAAASKWLVAFDRHRGKHGDEAEVLWTRRAEANFRHNAIAVGDGKVFCIAGISQPRLQALRRRGIEADDRPTLYALDGRTGRVLWKVDEDVRGTWVAHADEHDLVLVAHSRARDRALDEADVALAVYRDRDGKRLWTSDESYEGPCMIHGKRLITQRKAFSLLTGRAEQREHPLTGETIPWRYRRNYGCNTAVAGKHLILFRSAAAGYYDLEHDGGTGNLGGFKSGCTSNLIAACGILSAPDYTRTCTCSYQNQCSVAFVHDPDAEVWTFQAHERLAAPLKRVGVNFGAPGDWPAPGGTLWLDVPSVGGPGPDLGVTVNGTVRYFRRHSLEVQGPGRQVTASGLEGAATVRLPMNGDDERPFTVRLYFCEPTATASGRRVFDVRLQGEAVLEDLDVWAEAGGCRKGLVKTFERVPVGEHLAVELRPADGSDLPPVLGGIEAVLE
jgi:outer membrane protein assembly factor BamB